MDYGGIYINRNLKDRGGRIGTLCYSRDLGRFTHPFSPMYTIKYKVQYTAPGDFNKDKSWAFKAGPSVLVEWGEDDN